MDRDFTLGILAGGRATRLGGVDKAWLSRDGEPQVLRLIRCLEIDAADAIVSANRDLPGFARHGLRTVTDRTPGLGPLGGLDALAQACKTSWLLTLPIDLVSVDGSLPGALASAGGQGARAQDDEGPQPLVALWRVDALRAASVDAIARRALAVHALQSQLGMACVRFDGVRFGNLNTPADLAAAGIALPAQ